MFLREIKVFFLKSTAIEVKSSAQPKLYFMIELMDVISVLVCKIHKVNNAAEPA
jgi:hypothetical protein